MTVWFTSDLHLGHANVIKYCRRPFPHVDAMNEALISGWNDLVKDTDTVYVLGDVALCRPALALSFVSRLRGRKHLVFGNHDKPLRKHYQDSGLFEWCKDLAQIKHENQTVVLCHYPMMTWNKSGSGSWHLHGHCHGSLPLDRSALRMDIGIDPNGYAPVSFESVTSVMSRRSFKAVDHRGAD